MFKNYDAVQIIFLCFIGLKFFWNWFCVHRCQNKQKPKLIIFVRGISEWGSLFTRNLSLSKKMAESLNMIFFCALIYQSWALESTSQLLGQEVLFRQLNKCKRRCKIEVALVKQQILTKGNLLFFKGTGAVQRGTCNKACTSCY